MSSSEVNKMDADPTKNLGERTPSVNIEGVDDQQQRLDGVTLEESFGWVLCSGYTVLVDRFADNQLCSGYAEGMYAPFIWQRHPHI